MLLTYTPCPRSDCGMGDKIKRTADSAAIDRTFVEMPPKVWTPPRCDCGVPATVEVNHPGRPIVFYCTKHLPSNHNGGEDDVRR